MGVMHWAEPSLAEGRQAGFGSPEGAKPLCAGTTSDHTMQQDPTASHPATACSDPVRAELLAAASRRPQAGSRPPALIRNISDLI